MQSKTRRCWAAAAGKTTATTTRTSTASIGNAFNTHAPTRTTYPPPSLVRVRGASREPWDLKAASEERGRTGEGGGGDPRAGKKNKSVVFSVNQVAL